MNQTLLTETSTLRGDQLVGHCVYLYVPSNNIYMKARVCKYSTNRNLHVVEYTADKEKEAICINKVTWELCSANDPDFKPLQTQHLQSQAPAQVLVSSQPLPQPLPQPQPQPQPQLFSTSQPQLQPASQIVRQNKNHVIVISNNIKEQLPIANSNRKQLKKEGQENIDFEAAIQAAYTRIDQLQTCISTHRKEVIQINTKHQCRKAELTKTLESLQHKVARIEEDEIALKQNVSELQQDFYDLLSASQLQLYQKSKNSANGVTKMEPARG